MANGGGSKTGVVIGALVIGGILGYLIGRATAPKPATNPCTDPGDKNVSVRTDGTLSCQEIWLWTTTKDQATWTAPAGSTLVISFKDSGIFTPHSSETSPNIVTSGQPSSSVQHGYPYDYSAIVYGKGTPTPGAGTPTPTPSNGAKGRIIIKP